MMTPILLWSGALLGAIIVLLIAAYFCLRSWLQGNRCRTFLAGVLKDKTKAQDVSIPESLSVSGNRITLPSCTVHNSSYFEMISVRKMSVDIDRSALLSRTLRLGNFSAEEMQLVFRQGKTTSPAKTWSLNINNGRIITPFSWLNDGIIKSTDISYRNSDIQLNDCRIELAPGHLDATGSYDRKNDCWKAHIDISQINAGRLQNSVWSKYLTGGEISGHISLSGKASDDTREAKGELKLSGGELKAKPFLEALLSRISLGGIASYLPDIPSSLSLEESSCNVHYPYSDPEHGLQNALLWDNITVRDKTGEYRLSGQIITGLDGALSGTLELSISVKVSSMKINLPVLLKLSGTLDEPQYSVLPELDSVLAAVRDAAKKAALDAAEEVVDGAEKLYTALSTGLRGMLGI